MCIDRYYRLYSYGGVLQNTGFSVGKLESELCKKTTHVMSKI